MNEQAADTVGPVELVVVGFSGSRLSGEIGAALTELLDRGLVRIIDLAVISKEADGTVTILETQELTPEVASAFARIEGTIRGLLSEADLDDIAEDLEPGSTEMALLFEHVWAARFATAVRAAGGELVMSERIPHAVIAEARASLLAAAG